MAERDLDRLPEPLSWPARYERFVRVAAWKLQRGHQSVEHEDLLQEGRLAIVTELRREAASGSDSDVRVYLAARRGMIDAYRRERGRKDSSARRQAQFISLDAPSWEDDDLCGHDLLAAPVPDRYELDDIDLAALRLIEGLPKELRLTVLSVAHHGRKSGAARTLRVSESLIGQRLKRVRSLIRPGLWSRFRDERGDRRLQVVAS